MNILSHNSSHLYEYLSKLNKVQFKAFYGMLVHYWVTQKAFISKQNFFNLWCELNVLCHEINEGFPDITDHELIKSYCHAHPYYFIDILDTGIVAKLLCEYLDDRIDILTTVAQKLDTGGIWAACECVNEALGMSEDIDELVTEIEQHIKDFSC
ncbi:MAG: hypothetical protein J6L85_04910 [Clostridia bacterium]|nr:hypothetical protein [Clostridia bacterium]